MNSSKSQSAVVLLRNITEQIQSLQFSTLDFWLRDLIKEVFTQWGCEPKNVLFSALLKLSGKNIRLHGKIVLEFDPPCDRCGKNFRFPLHHEFEMILIPRKNLVSLENLPSNDELSSNLTETPANEKSRWGTSDALFVAEDVASSIITGEDLNLEPYFKEQIFLSLPMTLICQANCPGLCPICGADLRENPCRCKELEAQSQRGSVWGPLANFKVKP